MEIDYNKYELIRTQHTTPETAYTIDGYPYGFFLKTQKRYWIETNKKGDRINSQTKNPKTQQWNKPKRSTYTAILVLIIEKETGHITNTGIDTAYTSTEEQEQFTKWIGTDYILNDLQAKKLRTIKALNNTRKHIKVSISSMPTRTPEEQKEHDQQQEEQKKRIHKLFNYEYNKLGKE